MPAAAPHEACCATSVILEYRVVCRARCSPLLGASMLLGPDKNGSARCAMRQRRDQTSRKQCEATVCSHALVSHVCTNCSRYRSARRRATWQACLDISMQDVPCMHVCKSRSDLPNPLHHLCAQQTQAVATKRAAQSQLRDQQRRRARRVRLAASIRGGRPSRPAAPTAWHDKQETISNDADGPRRG